MAAVPQDAPRHAGQVVRRVLLRRNIAIDTETAQLVANAVQAALRAGAPSPAAAPTSACSPACSAPLLFCSRGPHPVRLTAGRPAAPGAPSRRLPRLEPVGVSAELHLVSWLPPGLDGA